MKELKLKDDFMYGVATASTQIEGGFTNSNWNYWYAKGRIKDGSNPERANGHYERFKEDIDLMSVLNIQTYRFSIEWSRLEPEQGTLNQEAIDHYKEELQYLKSKNIKPLMTLHHFNNPMWFEKLGGFLNNSSPLIFANFVSEIVKEFADLVDEYITINEPNVYATSAYYFGDFPPGKKSISATRKVMTNLASAHIMAFNIIHATRKKMGYTNTKVGYASHLRVFAPKRPKNIFDKIGSILMEQMFQTGIDETALTGVRKFPLLKRIEFKKGKYYDFIGINYYSRSMVKCFTEGAAESMPINDMGWEIYPEGIKTVTQNYFKKYKAPIYITENGIPDKADTSRCEYIYTHLEKITQSEATIDRYYYWTFIDNFEWIDGESEKFGLIELNYDTQERKIRKSAYFYSEIIKNKGVSKDMIARYMENKDE